MAKKNKEYLLELNKVSKSYGDLEILKNIDLQIEAGESVAIVGPSGSGKSTLLHLAGLMDRPSSGTMFLNNNEMLALDDTGLARLRLDCIGFLFQFHHLLPDFNVLENVLIPAQIAGDDMASAQKEALSLLSRLGLKNRAMHKPYEISGGEQQRAALARALIRHPKLLLCDEPTGNLDPDTAADVGDIIWSAIEQEGVGAIVVTHNDRIAKKADRVLRLVDGRFEK